jgi:ABC-type nickel/cobalt efflux system permease component RcnA
MPGRRRSGSGKLLLLFVAVQICGAQCQHQHADEHHYHGNDDDHDHGDDDGQHHGDADHHQNQDLCRKLQLPRD